MARIEDLKASSRTFIKRYPFPSLGPPPLKRLNKPISESRVCLFTTAGLHLRTDRPFSSKFSDNDASFRIIPENARLDSLSISHTSGDFDRSGINEDLNVVFPIDRLKELEAEGYIGAVTPFHFSFMGSLARVGELRRRTAPEAALKALEQGTDIALLTPV